MDKVDNLFGGITLSFKIKKTEQNLTSIELKN